MNLNQDILWIYRGMGLWDFRYSHVGMSSETSEKMLSRSKLQWCPCQGMCTVAHFPNTKFLQWYIKNEDFSILTNYKKKWDFYGPKFILNMCNIWHFVLPQKYIAFCFPLKNICHFICFFEEIIPFHLLASYVGTQIIHYPKSY